MEAYSTKMEIVFLRINKHACYKTLNNTEKYKKDQKSPTQRELLITL
jgi:hypothetical protein